MKTTKQAEVVKFTLHIAIALAGLLANIFNL